MHIVVADYGQTLLKMIQGQIQERGDTARVFSNGLEARNYIRSGATVDVLLTGLELKTMSGLELCWDVRLETDVLSPTYIIVMSSSSDVHRLVEALDCGADDFLKKPFVPEELFARLRTAQRVRSAQRDLIRLATIDSLTGVCNRRSLFERMRTAIESATADQPVSAIMLDVDHFKNVNDVYGHNTGDTVLRKLAQTIGSDCPIFGRFGGEEFVALVVGKSTTAAYDVAEGMRRKIGAMVIPAGETTISITCSFGVSEWQRGDHLDNLIKKADMALYAAKRDGRNRSVIFDPELETHDHGSGSVAVTRQGCRNND